MKKIITVILLGLIMLTGCNNNTCSIKDEAKLTKITYYSSDNKLLGTTSYSYDEKGRVIKMTSDNYHYEYNYDTDEAAYIEEQYNEEESTPYIINYFDEHDNPLKTYYRNDETGEYYLGYTYENIYDQAGRLLKMTAIDSNGYVFIDTYEYIESDTYTVINTNTVSESTFLSRMISEYTDSSMNVKLLDELYLNEEDNLDMHREYLHEFDLDGNIIKTTISDTGAVIINTYKDGLLVSKKYEGHSIQYYVYEGCKTVIGYSK
ncbi:MAG: hypothetical protein ACI4WM_04090 [Erysipelotrichaceae bacterium]